MKINENAAPRGTQLFKGLLALKDNYDIVRNVRGGHRLMATVELVSDLATKAAATPVI